MANVNELLKDLNPAQLQGQLLSSSLVLPSCH